MFKPFSKALATIAIPTKALTLGMPLSSLSDIGSITTSRMEKKDLNLSSFTKLPLRVQNHKFEEIIEMIEKKEMPLESYTYFGLHPEANLTEKERKTLVNWAKDQMDRLAATHPADSLKMKPRI